MLNAGTKLGPYEIQSPIGAGGMGEVYRARDSRLGRDVALKVLPESFASDAQRMARFRREAQVLASLNHPNIAAIYGFEDSGKTHALVMELAEGPTLADRIKQGAVPLDEALPIAKQICEGLEYAHERGIVHRDLKPSNIKITADGQVKVLDFGLAKAIEGDAGASSVESSPTLSAMATRAGFLLGTAAYMSPEQARGKAADRRADIWAFGVVLYEMLSGRRLFIGETTSDTLAAVIRAEPDWNALPANSPPAIRSLLRRCLNKDPRQRLQSIGDARIAIEDYLANPKAVEPGADAAAGSYQPRWLAALPWLLAALLALGLAGAFIILPVRTRNLSQAVRLSIPLPSGQTFIDTAPNLAISPKGTEIAYVAAAAGEERQIWVRRLDDFAATPVPGTEGADSPFFSPDGQWLGFWTGAHLQKVALSGGVPEEICASNIGPYGATWAPGGSIYFSSEFTGIMRVSSAGGEIKELIGPDKTNGELGLIEPEVLPGGNALLFVAVKGFTVEQSSIVVASLSTLKRETLIENATDPQYFEPGYLVFGRSGTLWAAPFDAKRLKLSGPASPLVENVASFSHYLYNQFGVSRNGVLVYAPGSPVGVGRQLVELNRKGDSRPVTAETRPFEDLDVSPDGQHLALTIEGADWNVWTYDLQSNTLTRLTFENDNRDPIWSADGKRIAYDSLRNGRWGIYLKSADGTGTEQQIITSPSWAVPSSFSPDGRYLAYAQLIAGGDIWILPVESGAKPYAFFQSPATIFFPAFSPDGRWIAYESNASGRTEIYVQSFSKEGGKWEISSDGGARPVWPRQDNEIFYMNGNKLMAVPVQTSPTFSAGTPHMLFERNFFASGHYYDASPDGQRFYFIKSPDEAGAQTHLNVILNWSNDVAKLPQGREFQ